MTTGYLVLAAALAVLLNEANRWMRLAGTLLAALALAMIVTSIVLANLDGTFAAIPADAPPLDRWKPFVLNTQALGGAAAALLLLWAAVMQARRSPEGPLPPRNSAAAFGRVSRYAHWMTATLVLILVPMGIFTSILPSAHPERESFIATHQSLGLVVLGLAALRLGWLWNNPGPAPPPALRRWERQAARATHVCLYALLLGFPLSGVLVTLSRGDPLEVLGWSMAGLLPPDPWLAAAASTVHGMLLPALFYVLIAAHVGAVAKHHVVDRRPDELRRMLR